MASEKAETAEETSDLSCEVTAVRASGFEVPETVEGALESVGVRRSIIARDEETRESAESRTSDLNE